MRNHPIARKIAPSAVMLAIVVGSLGGIPAPGNASAGPSPDAIASPAGDGSSWRQIVNFYRATANVRSVTENAEWSEGNELHARYMVKNGVIQHSEDTGNPWYTQAGHDAAENSNLAVWSNTDFSPQDAIELWMVGPFHGIGIIDPALTRSGYGEYHEAGASQWESGAGLDVIRGITGVPSSVRFPVKWPTDNAVTLIDSFGGFESPNPLTSCPGYTAPTGAPIMLQLGSTPNVTASSISRNGQALDHCVFDGTNYENPDPGSEELGRDILSSRNAVVLFPRAPLASGRYRVSVTSGGTETWSFSVAAHRSLECTITRGGGDNTVQGTPGDDVICAGPGNDNVYGRGGDDILLGEGGNDRLEGGPGSDILVGAEGLDTLIGGSSRDWLLGGEARDNLDSADGVSGNDDLNGDAGSDTCTRDTGDRAFSC